MSKIAVIIDSSSAMPVAIRNRYHIFQVNDPIIFGDEVYKETVDIHSLGELVKMMQEKSNWPPHLNRPLAIGKKR